MPKSIGSFWAKWTAAQAISFWGARARSRNHELFWVAKIRAATMRWKSLFRRDAETNTRDACAPRHSDLLPQLRLRICSEIFVWDELLLASRHILDFQLWPFVSEQHRNKGAELLGGLELLSDSFARQRVIDAVATVAKLLNLFQRVGTTFFFRDHNVDVDFPAVLNCFLHRFMRVWDFVD